MKGTQAIPWRTGFDTALAEAGRRRMLALVSFVSAGRPVSRTMDEQSFSRPEVLRAAAAFIPVRIDAEARPDLFERVIGGRGALATAVVDATGDTVAALSGFVPPELLVPALDGARAGYARLVAARTAARRRPSHPTALAALADSYEMLGSARRAEETFALLVEVAKRDGRPSASTRAQAAAAHERLARAQITRGRNLEARTQLEAYQRLDPQDLAGARDAARFTEALILFVERQLVEARRLLDALLMSNQVGPPMARRDGDHRLYVLAAVQHELKDDAGALATLERLGREHAGSRWALAGAEQAVHIKNPSADHDH